MTWENCKNYGLAIPETNGCNIRLFYGMLDSCPAITPSWLTVESAVWQGNFLQVKGKDPHGVQKIILMDGFNSWIPVL
jgi:hypothetical protein